MPTERLNASRTSIAKAVSPRQSNMELLRIVAMAFVVILHISYLVLPKIPSETCVDEPVKAMLSAMSIDFTLVCIPLFALLSGWFGICLTARRFCKFLYQCVFLTVMIIIALAAFGVAPSAGDIVKTLLFFKTNRFIMSYIGLMIFAPVLNSFVEHSTKKAFTRFMALYMLLACIWGTLYSLNYFAGGYSLFTLVLYYMLGRWFRFYGNPRWYRYGLILYIGLSLLSSVLTYLSARYTITLFWGNYLNPLIVLSSASLFLWFTTLKIPHNRTINAVSASIFAVYFIHTSPLIWNEWFIPFLRDINPEGSLGMQIALYSGVLILIFTGSIIVDQLRIAVWNAIQNISPNNFRRCQKTK